MGEEREREKEKESGFSADNILSEFLASRNEVKSFILNFHHCRINQLLSIPSPVRARVYFSLQAYGFSL